MILELGLASGQPFSEIARLRLNEAEYIVRRIRESQR